MNGRWLLANRDFLVRDLVRDYCTVYSLLADQRHRFDVDGAVSYTALRDLLGEAMRKGQRRFLRSLLWPSWKLADRL